MVFLSIKFLHAQLPDGFNLEIASEAYVQPLGIVFANDSISFVFERTGRIYQQVNWEKKTPSVIDIHDEVFGYPSFCQWRKSCTKNGKKINAQKVIH